MPGAAHRCREVGFCPDPVVVVGKRDPGCGAGFALCVAVKLAGKPHQNSPAGSRGFVASDNGVTSSNSLDEKVASL